MEIDSLKLLRNDIENLEPVHQKEVFEIIKKTNIGYTKNKNGIFINLYSIEDEHIDNMYKIIVDKIQYTNLINNNDFDIKNQFIPQSKITDNIINYKNINDENFDNYDIDLINFY